jgi:hypothetical protein
MQTKTRNSKKPSQTELIGAKRYFSQINIFFLHNFEIHKVYGKEQFTRTIIYSVLISLLTINDYPVNNRAKLKSIIGISK